MAAKRFSFSFDGCGYGTVIVLSGIQSTAMGQALGLYPALREHYAKIVGYDTNNVSWRRPERLAAEIAALVADAQRKTGRVLIIGLSIGAVLSVLVTAELRKIRARQEADDRYPSWRDATVADPEKFRVIMVDPPFGVETMMGVPGWLAPVAHSLFVALGAIVPSGIKMRKYKMAENDDVWEPTLEDMRVMYPLDPDIDYGRYQSYARQTDMENQVGHSWRFWFQQLAFMTGGALKVPFEAMRGVRADLLVCEGESNRNTVVRSDLAAPKWEDAVEFRSCYALDTEHCATLRHQPVFADVFRELLNN